MMNPQKPVRACLCYQMQAKTGRSLAVRRSKTATWPSSARKRFRNRLRLRLQAELGAEFDPGFARKRFRNRLRLRLQAELDPESGPNLGPGWSAPRQNHPHRPVKASASPCSSPNRGSGYYPGQTDLACPP